MDFNKINIILSPNRQLTASSNILGVAQDANSAILNVMTNVTYAPYECIIVFGYQYNKIFESTSIPIGDDGSFSYTVPELILFKHGIVNVELKIVDGSTIVYHSLPLEFRVKASIESHDDEPMPEVPMSHNDLIDRDLNRQHPISAIDGLKTTLDNKAEVVHQHIIADISNLHDVTATEHGLMLSQDKTKLDDLAAGKGNVLTINGKDGHATLSAEDVGAYTRTQTSGLINQETTARLASESNLQSEIDTKISIVNANKLIQTERTDRMKADLELQNDIKTVDESVSELAAQVDTIEKGSVNYLGTINLVTEDVTQSALTNKANEILQASSKPRAIRNNDAITDANNFQWVYNEELGEWFDAGSRSAAVATNITVGLVQGSYNINQIRVMSDGTMILDKLESDRITDLAMSKVTGLLEALTNIYDSIDTVANERYTKSETDVLVSNLQTQIATEITDRTNADIEVKEYVDEVKVSLEEKIEDVSTSLEDTYTKTEIDAKVDTLQNSIDSEKSDRISGENSLDVKITTEAIQRAADVSDLQVQINDMKGGLYPKAGVLHYADLATTYPNPEQGWLVNVAEDETDNNDSNFYLYDGTAWVIYIAGGIDLSDYYTKSQTDNQIQQSYDSLNDIKADKDNVYTKSESDTAISNLKTYTDTELATKSNIGHRHNNVTATDDGFMASTDKQNLDNLLNKVYNTDIIKLKNASEKLSNEDNQSELNTNIKVAINTNKDGITSTNTRIDTLESTIDNTYMKVADYDPDNNGTVEYANKLIDNSLTNEMIQEGAVAEDKLSLDVQTKLNKDDSLLVQSDGIDVGLANILNFIGGTVTSHPDNSIDVEFSTANIKPFTTFNIVGNGIKTTFNFDVIDPMYPITQVYDDELKQRVEVDTFFSNNILSIVFAVAPIIDKTYTVIVNKYASSIEGSGSNNHMLLINRDIPNQHPISSITGLQTALGNKSDTIHTHTVDKIIADVSEVGKALVIGADGKGSLQLISGGSGSTDHNQLFNRDMEDQHTISSITGLDEELDMINADILITDTNVQSIFTTLNTKSDVGHHHEITDINELANTFDDMNDLIDTKADITYVDNSLVSKADLVHTHTTSNVNGLDTTLAAKANITYVDGKLTTKADIDYVDTAISPKANTTYVDSLVLPKADKTYVDNKLLNKADVTYVDAELLNKANVVHTHNPIDINATVADSGKVLTVGSNGKCSFQTSTSNIIFSTTTGENGIDFDYSTLATDNSTIISYDLPSDYTYKAGDTVVAYTIGDTVNFMAERFNRTRINGTGNLKDIGIYTQIDIINKKINLIFGFKPFLDEEKTWASISNETIVVGIKR